MIEFGDGHQICSDDDLNNPFISKNKKKEYKKFKEQNCTKDTIPDINIGDCISTAFKEVQIALNDASNILKQFGMR